MTNFGPARKGSARGRAQKNSKLLKNISGTKFAQMDKESSSKVQEWVPPHFGHHIAAMARGEESPPNVDTFVEVAERVQPRGPEKLKITQKFPKDEICADG